MQITSLLLQSLKVPPLSKFIVVFARDQESSVDTVKGYKLDSRGSISGRGKRFSLLHNIQTSSWV
jgi:hypothetical protein